MKVSDGRTVELAALYFDSTVSLAYRCRIEQVATVLVATASIGAVAKIDQSYSRHGDSLYPYLDRIVRFLQGSDKHKTHRQLDHGPSRCRNSGLETFRESGLKVLCDLLHRSTTTRTAF